MKPSDINKVLDLALQARQQGERFIPLFTGDAGLGKSSIVQAWARRQGDDFGFIDLRLATMEPPDLIGLPVFEGGRTRHMLPEFWPMEGRGVIVLEEVNRTPTSTTNAVMQLLTDFKVHNYTLPPGWMIVSCINEGTSYDVNNMDAALQNRFVMYPINYDHKGFIAHMVEAGYDEGVINFVKSGIWLFKPATEIAEKGKYISPRTLHALSSARKAGLQSNHELHIETATAILGTHHGLEFHNFIYDNAPVLHRHLIEDEKAAIKKLKKYSDPEHYRADIIALTVDNLVENYPPKAGKEQTKYHELLVKVMLVIPEDQAVTLIERATTKNLDKDYVSSTFVNDFPEVRKIYTKMAGSSRIKKDVEK